MSIVTISRGSYSKGKEVAEKLAGALGYECISREILLNASNEFNIPEIKLVRALHDAPTVLERFTNGKERYLSYLRSALLNRVLTDNVVYHGLAGHYFLQGIPHVFKVRIIADIEARVQEEMKRENIAESEARYILKKDDEERRRWALQIIGVDTWDPSLYDMVVHIGGLSVDDAVDILRHSIKKPCFQKTPSSEKILSDRALAARVLTQLIDVVPGTDVRADEGTVSIITPGVLSIDTTGQLKRLAQGVGGVKRVIVNDLSENGRGA